MQLRRCLIISLLKRDVLRIMFDVFSSFGEVLNTTHGMSDKIVLRIELAMLTFTPLNVNLSTSPSSETDLASIRGFIIYDT